MTAEHVVSAVQGFVERLDERGLLSSRPVRLDGFTRAEIDSLLPVLRSAIGRQSVYFLSDTTNEALGSVNPERATRYRNEVDSGERPSFVLLVPQSEVVESSLDEPAFLVVPRDSVFRDALARLRSERGLTSAQIEQVRQASRHRQAESVFAFFWSWDPSRGVVARDASHEHLGLLSDSGLSGTVDEICERLRENLAATDILFKAGQSPSRVLDELSSKVGLDATRSGEEVRELLRWIHGGRIGQAPAAIDFGSWERVPPDAFDINFQPDLTKYPHRGWSDREGQAEVDPSKKSTSFAWTPVRVPANAAYEVQLVEEVNQTVIVPKIGGRSGSTRRSINWTTLLRKEEVIEQLRAAQPAGDEEGFLVRLRLNGYEGKRWRPPDYTSETFVVRPDGGEVEQVVGTNPSAYHALYRFHAEQRVEAPAIDNSAAGGTVVHLESESRSRDAALDVTEALAHIERTIAASPEIVGPWHLRAEQSARAIGGIHLESSAHLRSIGGFDALGETRARLFQLLAPRLPIEAIDVRDPEIRAAIEAYCHAFGEAVDDITSHIRAKGVAADEDVLRLASLMSIDSVIADVPEDGGSFKALLLPPLHPVSLAWLCGFADLVHEWTRGPWDGDRKPPYSGSIDALSVGPRTLVLPVREEGNLPTWWAYAGNATGTWQCFLPLTPAHVRGTPWEESLADFVGLSRRRMAGGRMDARRVGGHLKRYAVLHPYVKQLKLAALLATDGMDVLDALKVIDEARLTPPGAKSVREIRYELGLLGPRSSRLGRAIEDMAQNPGDAKWRKYAAAIMDNPETVLSPGFAFARRPISHTPGSESFWAAVKQELAATRPGGVHVALIGPMLTPGVGAAKIDGRTSLRLRGLVARPATNLNSAVASGAYHGDWVLTINVPDHGDGGLACRTMRVFIDGVNVVHGVLGGDLHAGLKVGLGGEMAKALRLAHEVSDWVIIADPLFSIELMDRQLSSDDKAVLLDYSPEFDPYPGGRVVVTTGSLGEPWDIDDPVGQVMTTTGPVAKVLASISSRLLLGLANPTRQVTSGLAGLALTRLLVDRMRPGSLVLPVDGHENTFASRHSWKGGELADLIAVECVDGRLSFHVVESKWASPGDVGNQRAKGRKQVRATADVLLDEYLRYDGVDRELRVERLRDVLLFHLARARRHGVQVAFGEAEVIDAFGQESGLASAEVGGTVVVWVAGGSPSSGPLADDEGFATWELGQSDIEAEAHRLEGWPGAPDSEIKGTDSKVIGALTEMTEMTLTDDLRRREAEELASLSTVPSSYPGDDLNSREERRISASEAAGLPDEGLEGVAVTPIEPPASAESKPEDVALEQALSGAETTAGSPTDRMVQDAPESTQPETTASPIAATPQAAPPPPCVCLGSMVPIGRPASWCPSDLSNGHMIVIGGSGAGKTTALRHIISQLRRAVPVLVLDFHGDLEPYGSDEEVYNFEFAQNSAFVNPFHLDPRYALTPVRLKWEFLEAWRKRYPTMGVHQINYLAELIEDAFAAKGITEDPATWTRPVTFGDVIEQFDRSGAPENQKAKILSYMKQFREWQIFHGGTPIAVERFLDASVRLNLADLDENARDILADVVLRRLFLLARALGPIDPAAKGWDKFRAFVTIDEAQVLMGSSGDAKASLSKYAAEARKFGIGLILATQLRDNVPGEIWGNIDTRLFMQALDPVERSRNAKAANVSEETLRLLERGEAMLITSSQPNIRPQRVHIEPPWIYPDGPCGGPAD